MKQFPDPVLLPKSVQIERQERKKQLVTSATSGVLIRLFIILLEFIGAWYFASSAIFMDGLASFVDVFFSLVLIFIIRFAAKPPDDNHPFGHGRLEPLVGMQIGVLISCIGLFALIQQIGSVNIEEQGTVSPYACLLPLIAVGLLEICYRVVMKASKEQNSPALAVDALHYRIDAITSALAAIALIIAAFTPSLSLIVDHFGAIAIACFMMVIGCMAAKNNLYQLIDQVPEQQYFDLVKNAAKRVEGVKDTEKIRIQQYGPDAHVNIDIEVDPNMKVELAHEITQKVRAEIQKDWPAVRDVTVHVEPFYPGDH